MPLKCLQYLKNYRMPFRHWLWFGAAFWLIALVTALLVISMGTKTTTTFILIAILFALLVLYYSSTVRYYDSIIQRLTGFLKQAKSHRIELSATDLIEHGEVADLFQSVRQAAASLNDHFHHADQVVLQERLLSEVIQQSTNSVVITDTDARIVFVNAAFCRISGYSAEEVIGQTPKLLQSGLTPPKTYREIRKTLAKDEVWYGELINRCKDGTFITEQVTITPIKNNLDQTWRLMAVKTDVSAIKVAQKRIVKLAYSDSVTGLANRHSLQETFAQWQGHLFSLVLININDFKHINTQYGHIAADHLLARLAEKMTDTFPKNSFLARLNSDEFIALVPDYSIQQLTDLLQQQLSQLDGLTDAGLYQISISCRFGVCFYPQHGQSLSDLLSNADIALRLAKHQHKRMVIFEPLMKTHLDMQLKQLAILQQELDRANYLSLKIQPQVDLHTGDCVGGEVLLRLNHPDLPATPIISYIQLAERYGLIQRLDRWVVQQSIQLLLRLQQQGFSGKLSINLSAASFQNNEFVAFVEKQLTQYELINSNLTLEITETALMTQPHSAIRNAERLQQLGICLAIDDFGTGHSSLAYLQKFSVCQLKIDKSFIDHITTNDKDRAIVETTLLLAKGLQLKTVSEGIENQQQWHSLKAMGCHFGQGYYFSKALTESDFIAFALPEAAVPQAKKQQRQYISTHPNQTV